MGHLIKWEWDYNLSQPYESHSQPAEPQAGFHLSFKRNFPILPLINFVPNEPQDVIGFFWLPGLINPTHFPLVPCGISLGCAVDTVAGR